MLKSTTDKYEYSLGLTIKHDNGHHVTFALFSKMKLREYKHSDVTRAGIGGQLTEQYECFIEFVKRARPHIIIWETAQLAHGFVKVLDSMGYEYHSGDEKWGIRCYELYK